MRSPSTAELAPLAKARELFGYFQNHRRRQGGRRELGYLADVEEYAGLLREHCDRDLAGAAVLEVGFGPRPYRLAVLSAAGAQPIGVDIEAPLVQLSPRALARIRRASGSERMVKSLARHLLFDRAAKRELQAALASRYGSSAVDFGRLCVGDAADLGLEKGSLDLIVSEDVFEHIAPESLARTLTGMRRWLRPRGLALVRPNVFTGISGGHLAGWSVESLLDRPEEPRRSAPWEHLRSGRFEPNTFLNRLSRAEYRRLFAEHGFEVVAEHPRYPALGASWLTESLRAELADWPDEELFSNQVLFVLSPG